MRLKYGIAANLGFVACLSSFMLSLGGEEYGLPVFVFFIVVASFFLTDWTRLLRLGDWTSNAILLLIVFTTVGGVLKYHGEGLALSIARVVVLVQAVLFFKEKTPRNCWHILLLSFLQVVVASVFQQNAAYALLLVLYVFASLCAFCLIFLYRENLYFQHHTFLRSRGELLQSRISFKEQDRGRLLRIIVATVLTGPLAFFLAFNEKKGEGGAGDDKENADKTTGNKSTGGKTASGHHVARDIWDTDALWEEESSEEEGEDADMPAERTFSSVSPSSPFVFTALRFRKRERIACTRWPLLDELPRFSGGTRREGTIGNHAALYRWLAKWTLFSLVLSAVVFTLFPRFEEVELFGTSFSYDNWGVRGSALSTVGFSENVRLGSLGNVIQQHREIMSVKFFEGTKNDGSLEPYTEIDGRTVYYRGVVLLHYDRGTWNDRPVRNRYGATDPPRNPMFGENPEDTPADEEETTDALNESPTEESTRPSPPPENADENSAPNVKSRPAGRPASDATGQATDREETFAPQGDRVLLQMVVQPLQTDVLFAPWPCSLPRQSRNRQFGSEQVTSQFERLSRTVPTRGILRFEVATAAFLDGRQLALIPSQETAVPMQLLQLPSEAERKLPTLLALAAQWDRESGLPKTDVIGRARFLESKFMHSERFRYKLGGVVRNLGTDPVEDFIAANPEGHCEYFSSALALMLRSVGIGSRIVVGYKSDCDDASDGWYSVRQSDAHSWVEAYVPHETLPEEIVAYDHINRIGRRLFRHASPTTFAWDRGGWLRLDPTPASAEEREAGPPFRWSDLAERAREFWNDYVINMNPGRQAASVYAPLRQCGSWLATNVLRVEFWKAVLPDLIAAYKKSFDDLRRGRGRIGELIVLVLPPLVLVAILIVLVRFLVRRLGAGVSRRIAGIAGNRRGTVEFYRRLEKLLAKRGMRRGDSQTQAAFLRDCEPRLPFPVALEPLAEAFYRVRFGNQKLAPEELAAIETTLARVADMRKREQGTGNREQEG